MVTSYLNGWILDSNMRAREVDGKGARESEPDYVELRRLRSKEMDEYVVTASIAMILLNIIVLSPLLAINHNRQ